MKNAVFSAIFAMLISLFLPVMIGFDPVEEPAVPAESAAVRKTQVDRPVRTLPTSSPAPPPADPAPETVSVLDKGEVREVDMQEYLVGVLAAEMPAYFESEALKAQTVAARTFAIYCARTGKHENADVCTDYTCCQAWKSTDAMRESWGASFDEYYAKISSAVADTRGQYILYDGEPIFAAFHSSSAGMTETCGEVWSALPYLVSVSSPETAQEVPNYVSTVSSSALDFRDTILSAYPGADLTGDACSWIGELTPDSSGRVASSVIGGTAIPGTKLRELFALRSTAFSLTYADGVFTFTVTGFGHGIGLSQYGADVMAREGSDYAAILAHYYKNTYLSLS